jgi:GTP-dependent phosphoenolpyruvate carboxykinase
MSPLDESRKPNNFCAVLDPTDVARVEDRSYICRVKGRMTPGPTTTGWTRTR